MEAFGEDRLQLFITTYWLITPTVLLVFAEAVILVNRKKKKVDLFNNVIYNYGSDGAYAGEGGSYNFINNYYKPGPFSATKGSFKRLFTAYADDGTNKNEAGVHGIFYFNGNYMDPTCSKLTDKQKKLFTK